MLADLRAALRQFHRAPGFALVVVLVLGFVVAPYMISVFMLGERAAPAAKVGTAMTLLAGATGIGYAVGSAVSGRLADAYGHPGAFAVPCPKSRTVARRDDITCRFASRSRWLRRLIAPSPYGRIARPG